MSEKLGKHEPNVTVEENQESCMGVRGVPSIRPQSEVFTGACKVHSNIGI